MPISAAALDGIRENGHRWRSRIRLGQWPALLGKLNDATSSGAAVDEAQVERAALRIVAAVRSFAELNPQFHGLTSDADNLEMAADCGLEEVNGFMGELYDTLDWHRILVESPRLPAIAMEARQGPDRETGLDAEGATARPEGIAQ